MFSIGLWVSVVEVVDHFLNTNCVRGNRLATLDHAPDVRVGSGVDIYGKRGQRILPWGFKNVVGEGSIAVAMCHTPSIPLSARYVIPEIHHSLTETALNLTITDRSRVFRPFLKTLRHRLGNWAGLSRRLGTSDVRFPWNRLLFIAHLSSVRHWGWGSYGGFRSNRRNWGCWSRWNRKSRAGIFVQRAWTFFARVR